jgi:peptide/nickel transport system substrate-binding protein
MRKRFIRATAFATALGLLAAACGDDSSKGSDASTGASGTGAAGTTAATTTLAPVKGGILTIGTYSEAPGLDPITTSGAGTTYGMELAAMYDRLILWDPIAKKYEPRLAESFTNNADFTEWTLKIRSGVKFGDGTSYDAEAVKFNLDRHKAENSVLRGPLSNLKDVAVVDPLTVKITLTDSWPGFLSLLAASPGMVASPAVIKAQGKGFPVNPAGAGAGPFQFDSLKPKEALTLKRNPSYWGGEVYLDGLKFVLLGGAQANLDALKAGSIDATFLREAAVIDEAKKAGFKGLSNVQNIGEMILINAGVEVTCTGGKPEPTCAGQADGTKIATKTPGSNLKVRQAVFAALDIAQIDQRANNGKGIPATSVYDTSFPWNPNVTVPKADPAKAKQLVQEAKSAGWDGKIRLSCTNTPQRQGTAIAVQTQLTAAGFEVDMTRSNLDVNQVIADVITNKNYDLACWGASTTPDDYAYVQLDSLLRSTSGSNRTGYKSATMDAALNEAKKASTDAAKTAAYKKIGEVLIADAVFAPIAHAEEYVTYSSKVVGARATSAGTLEFSKAYKVK